MNLFRKRLFAAMLGSAALLVAGASLPKVDADSARFADGSDGVDWPGYGRTFGEQHFSPLTQINSANIGRLRLAWYKDIEPGNTVKAPIEVGGVLYFVHRFSTVHAVDAKTGKELWVYDPKIYEYAPDKMRNGWGSRGVAYWNGKIYLGSQDGRLIALNAKTGKVVWTAMTIGKDDNRFITGAPRVFGGKVIIGNGGADVAAIRGYVTTYDAETGKQLWRWYTVPGNPADGFENDAMEMAAKTWAGEWWKYGGGGTVWNNMSYDAETNTAFLGVGNGSPWNHKVRSQGKGDNLFLCSVVALDATTGKYKWHYQVNPGESWDYNASMDMALADIDIAGQKRKVLMTAPKNGFFYVIDRITGKLISAEPYVKVTWASKIDLVTGRPVENPAARYPEGTTFELWPSSLGAHSTYAMAYSPKSGFAYVPASETGSTWTDMGVKGDEWRKYSPQGMVQAAAINNAFADFKDPRSKTSKLVAIDPRTQKIMWSQPTPGTFGGGVLATGGNLVFEGRLDGVFAAYAADSGKMLWSFQARAPVMAMPISYSVGGRQYISVLTGNAAQASMDGGAAQRFNVDYRTPERRLLTFVLDGPAKLPPAYKGKPTAAEDSDYKPDTAKAQAGYMVTAMRCFACHGIDAISAGAAPDLRASAIPQSAEAFKAIVHDGALMPVGMPHFPELTDEQLDQARQYLRSRAAEWRAASAKK